MNWWQLRAVGNLTILKVSYSVLFVAPVLGKWATIAEWFGISLWLIAACFFASLSLALANLIYDIRCPIVVKRFASRNDLYHRMLEVKELSLKCYSNDNFDASFHHCKKRYATDIVCRPAARWLCTILFLLSALLFSVVLANRCWMVAQSCFAVQLDATPPQDETAARWVDVLWLSGLVLAFIGYAGVRDLMSLLWDRWYRAALDAELAAPPYTEAVTPESAPHLIRFYHIIVRNTGKSPASSCEARLMWVRKLTDNKWVDIRYSGVLPLHWAHRDLKCECAQIRPEESLELDLCTQDPRNPSRLDVFSTSGALDGLVHSYDPGEYQCLVRISSKNAKTKDLMLRLTMPADGSPLEIAVIPNH